MTPRTTHYVRWEAPDSRVATAVCGAVIDSRGPEFSASPSCPACHAWIHQDDGKTAEDMFGAPEPTPKGAL